MIRSLLVLFLAASPLLSLHAELSESAPAASPASEAAPAPAPEGPAPAGAAAAEPEQAAPAPEVEQRPAPPSLSAAPRKFYVLEVNGPINKPTLFIVRRGVKEAIESGVDTVILDMDTPGGGLAETLEIMEILTRFSDSTNGKVITFVRNEAGSAGAIIAAITDEIYFAPRAVIGAAEVVLATGEDVGDGMKRKITSFLAAKVRAFSEKNPMRGKVLQAMMDPTYELTIDGTVIKAKDTLLTLTAAEAIKEYGDPPQPLFGSGIVADLGALKTQLAQSGAFESRSFVMTWSLELARWLTAISPLLLGVGGMMLAVEFKTPGFGWIGATGILLMLIVFFGHHVAGLAGHEPMLFFLLGVALVFVEMLLLPGTFIFATLGGLLMLASLLWGMADIWPNQGWKVSPAIFLTPAYKLSLGFILAACGFALLLKYLPTTSIWGRMELAAEIKASSADALRREQAAIGVGSEGVVLSPLRPTGTVEIAGRRFEARSEVGEIAAGTPIRVVRRADFVLVVESIPS